MADHCTDIEEFIAALEKRRDQLISIVTDRQLAGERTNATRRQIKELQAQILQEMILLQKCSNKIPASLTVYNAGAAPVLNVYILTIHYTGPGFTDVPVNKTADVTNILQTLDKLQQVYSIGHINITGMEIFDWSRQLKFVENREALLEKIRSLRSISGNNALHIGFLPEEAGYSGLASNNSIAMGTCLLSACPGTIVKEIAPVIEQVKAFADQYSDQPAGEKKQVNYYHLNFHRDHLQQQVMLKSAFHLYQEEPAASLQKKSSIRAYFYSNENVLMYSGYASLGLDQPTEKTVSAFQLSFPFMENMQRIQLVENNYSIGEFYIAPTAPQVYITGIDFREEAENHFLHIGWEGSVAGYCQPGLVYAVRYSADGFLWQTLLADTHTNCYQVNTNQLPGGSACRVQVIASAGLRTSVAESYHFTLPVKPRILCWMYPAPQSAYAAGSPVYLAATAYSSNFNNALPGEITWTSLKHGYLGTGQQLTVTHLSRGKDWIQVHIPDGLGNLLTKQVEISIV